MHYETGCVDNAQRLLSYCAIKATKIGLRALLRFNINIQDKEGNTALHYAINSYIEGSKVSVILSG